MDEHNISKAVIRRLPRYHRYLGYLIDEKVERISSNELSRRMKVTASQIRQDLNNFGGFGQQGYGYNVKYLYQEIGKILGLDKTYSMIVIGSGNLGQAIANYVKFATLTLPKAGAEAVAGVIVENGVRAIWNFAHTDLELPDDVIVENVHLSESLMQLTYKINHSAADRE